MKVFGKCNNNIKYNIEYCLMATTHTHIHTRTQTDDKKETQSQSEKMKKKRYVKRALSPIYNSLEAHTKASFLCIFVLVTLNRKAAHPLKSGQRRATMSFCFVSKAIFYNILQSLWLNEQLLYTFFFSSNVHFLFIYFYHITTKFSVLLLFFFFSFICFPIFIASIFCGINIVLLSNTVRLIIIHWDRYCIWWHCLWIYRNSINVHNNNNPDDDNDEYTQKTTTTHQICCDQTTKRFIVAGSHHWKDLSADG